MQNGISYLDWRCRFNVGLDRIDLKHSESIKGAKSQAIGPRPSARRSKGIAVELRVVVPVRPWFDDGNRRNYA